MTDDEKTMKEIEIDLKFDEFLSESEPSECPPSDTQSESDMDYTDDYPSHFYRMIKPPTKKIEEA